MASRRLSLHEGVSCDACSRSDFQGKRYKCLVCYDYDLCETCYEEGATSKAHNAEHAVQCILTPSDWELYYAGEPADQPQSFTCPICATMGFTAADLREHVSSEHSDNAKLVVCPVCAATPGGDPNHMTGDLAMHLGNDHGRCRGFREGETFAQRMVRVSQIHFSAVGSPVPGRMPQRQVPSRVIIPPSSPPDLESPGAISDDLQSQTLTGARGTSTLPRVSWAAPEIRQVRWSLEATRQELQAVFREHNPPRLRNPPPAVTSVYSLPPARFPDPVDAAPKPTLVEPPASDDPRFLLNGIVEADRVSDSPQQAREVERADRSFFVQELLLSALARETPIGPGGLWGQSKYAAVAVMKPLEQGTTKRPDATATISPQQKTTTSSKKPAAVGAESAVNTSPDPVHATSQEPTVTACLEPNVTPSPQSAVVVSPEMTSGTSLEPGAGDLAPTTITTSTEPTTPIPSGPNTSTSSGLTDHKPDVDNGQLSTKPDPAR